MFWLSSLRQSKIMTENTVEIKMAIPQERIQIKKKTIPVLLVLTLTSVSVTKKVLIAFFFIVFILYFIKKAPAIAGAITINLIQSIAGQTLHKKYCPCVHLVL